MTGSNSSHAHHDSLVQACVPTRIGEVRFEAGELGLRRIEMPVVDSSSLSQLPIPKWIATANLSPRMTLEDLGLASRPTEVAQGQAVGVDSPDGAGESCDPADLLVIVGRDIRLYYAVSGG